MSSYILITLL